MAAPSKKTTRGYRTDLRAKQAATTRTAIVTALTAELARSHETGSELSLTRVAAAAGVSVRTVYHHFPDRASQLAAIGHHLDAAPPDPHPTSLGDLPTLASRIAFQMLANPTLMRAEVVLNKQRRGRDAAIHRAVAKQTSPATAKSVGAALAMVLSPEVALGLLDHHRLDAATAETTITWMVQVLVDAVRNGDVPASGFKRTRRA